VSPELIRTEVFAELPKSLRKSGTPPERLAAGKSGNDLYITDSGEGCILRARVPIAGKSLFSHL
jgi:hypothetical protein